MAVYTVQFTPSEDDLAIGKSLAPLHSQALSVERVPTIIDGNDFNLPKMMGIMRLARRLTTCPTNPVHMHPIGAHDPTRPGYHNPIGYP